MEGEKGTNAGKRKLLCIKFTKRWNIEKASQNSHASLYNLIQRKETRNLYIHAKSLANIIAPTLDADN